MFGGKAVCCMAEGWKRNIWWQCAASSPEFQAKQLCPQTCMPLSVRRKALQLVWSAFLRWVVSNYLLSLMCLLWDSSTVSQITSSHTLSVSLRGIMILHASLSYYFSGSLNRLCPKQICWRPWSVMKYFAKRSCFASLSPLIRLHRASSMLWSFMVFMFYMTYHLFPSKPNYPVSLCLRALLKI